ncbi:ferritin-like fold-containing protein [Propionibacteriaceae bacterium Y2011]
MSTGPRTQLLAILACAELSAVERLAEDATAAPSLADKVAVLSFARVQLDHYQLLADQIVADGVDPIVAMEPFSGPLAEFHAHTTPRTWEERMIKIYVGDALAADLYTELSSVLPAPLAELIRTVADDSDQREFARARVVAAVDAEPQLSGRLALWARRLVGEALSQAQRIVSDNDHLAELLTGTEESTGLDLAATAEMFTRLIQRHNERMAKVGLRP